MLDERVVYGRGMDGRMDVQGWIYIYDTSLLWNLSCGLPVPNTTVIIKTSLSRPKDSFHKRK